jgi:hypothetical protein
MTFNEEELKQHCKMILKRRNISNKIIVLCEGNVSKRDRKSPQSYAQMDEMPDSSFYKACTPSPPFLPKDIPEFFNCSNGDNVIGTYSNLLEMLSQDAEKQYYHPKKIFAIIDLDNQKRQIRDYRFKHTQEIFCNLYEKAKINESNQEIHEIFVTGLIHKEAYFLVPALQSLFDKHLEQPFYQGNKLLLEDFYISMSSNLSADNNLKSNFESACSRINHCLELSFGDIDQLRDSWITEFQKAQDRERKHELVFSLLTITKVKDYWQQIHPNGKPSGNSHKYREQLALAIAKNFYAKQTDDHSAAQYHIPYFFQMLRRFI